MILQQEYQQKSKLLSRLSRSGSISYIFNEEKVKEKEATKNSNNTSKRKQEIIAFSKKLKEYNLSYSVLSSEKPKKKEEREKSLEIAHFISNDPIMKETLLNSKELPVETIIEQFNVPNKFIKKNKFYLIATSLLLIGPYSEMKQYFFGGDSLR